MSEYLAIPPAQTARGRVAAPPSKSATNRALVLAALSSAPVLLVRPLESEDTSALARCLAAMGARMTPGEEGLLVSGPLGRPEAVETGLDAGDSGTAARFLTAVAAAVPGRYRLTGSARMRERPMEELVAALTAAGAEIEYVEREGFLPLAVRGGTLRTGAVSVDASRSSQFLSALLLAAAAVEGGLEVRARGSVASAPYVATTLDALAAFGHEAAEGGAIRVRPGSSAPARYETPGDWSSALPLLSAAAAVGGSVTVTGLAHPSPDADARALSALEAMGARVEAGQGGVTVSAERGTLRPLWIAATDFPDAVPALAALAALAQGRSRFSGIGHLRWKESDRIEALARLVASAGGQAETGGDWLEITGPTRPSAGVSRLVTADDHRLAMAGALLALALPGMLVENPGCVAKSYPGFFRDLEALVVPRYPPASS